jgi:putative endonuclease
MAEHLQTGKKGEDLASEFLIKKGYKILETNWRYRNLEADIIASCQNEIILVEVKTRKSTVFGEPETFVNRQKQRNLIKTAHEYIHSKGLNAEVRFDIISIVIHAGGVRINHIESAFYPLL